MKRGGRRTRSAKKKSAVVAKRSRSARRDSAKRVQLDDPSSQLSQSVVEEGNVAGVANENEKEAVLQEGESVSTLGPPHHMEEVGVGFALNKREMLAVEKKWFAEQLKKHLARANCILQTFANTSLEALCDVDEVASTCKTLDEVKMCFGGGEDSLPWKAFMSRDRKSVV